MSYLIDVHVLAKSDDKGLPTLLSSLELEPVNVHICDPMPGDIATARSRAYRKGTAPFVCYVDPDDLVKPGIFSKLLTAYEPELVGVGSRQTIISGNGQPVSQVLYPKEWSFEWSMTAVRAITPAFIAKREVVLRVLDEHFHLLPKFWGQDRCIATLASGYGDWRLIADYGYDWVFTGQNISYLSYASLGYEEFTKRISPAIAEAKRLRGCLGRQ